MTQKKNKNTILKEDDINAFCKVLLLSPNFKFYDVDNEPELNLFYWCVFSNRIEIAKIFWKMGKVIYNHMIFHYLISRIKCATCIIQVAQIRISCMRNTD